MTLLGLMAGIAGSSWQTIVQRGKEQELLWRGGQIRKAIASYYDTKQGGAKKSFPARFDLLLKDARFISTKRHLRQHYMDPLTGDDWVILKHPSGGIKGVRSGSEKEPFKKENFRIENEKFAGKTTYAEWEFIYKPDKNKPDKTSAKKNKGSQKVSPAGGS